MRLASSVQTAARSIPLVRIGGHIVEASPAHCKVAGIAAHVRLGDSVALDEMGRTFKGEVVRIDADVATVKAFEQGSSIGLGHTLWCLGPLTLAPDVSWKGRVVDSLARPIDGNGPLARGPSDLATDSAPPDPMQRQRIGRALRTGVSVIDLFTPLCAGQRIGVFAGSGVGKSTLLGMLARSQGFDTSVIALVGERGREVREFIDDIVGTGLPRAIVVVSTGDESPMLRRQAPRTAMLIAETLRDRGENVLLIVDSVTRYAHALREVALAGGEPPVARGYAPSVFTDLPRLLERAGPGREGTGTITGVFSVLVDGDDHNEPVADAVRGILDGHIVLDRTVANRGQYPAVDVLRSVSRLADKAWSPEQRTLIRRLRAMIAEYEDTRDLRLMGAAKAGASADLDRAVKLVPKLYEYLSQAPDAPPKSDDWQELARALAGA